MSRRKKSGKPASAVRGRAGQGAADFESSLIRALAVWVVALKVVGLVVIFDPASASAFEVAKSTFSLATAAVLIGLIGLALLRHGWQVIPRTGLHALVVGFALASVLASLTAEDRYLALFGAQRRLGLTFVSDMIILYAAVAIAYRTRRDWAVLAAALACAGAIATVYGALQAVGLDPIPWAEGTRSRPPSTFGNPDKFGHFLGASFLAAVGLGITPLVSRKLRVYAGAYALLMLAAAVVVATRGTIVGVAIGLPVLGAVHLRFGRFSSRRTAFALSGAALISVMIFAVLMAATPLGARIRGSLADPGIQQRVFVADAAVRAFLDRPLTGYGPDNFGAIYPRYRPLGSVSTGGLAHQDSAHSLPLQTLATTGALGALSLGGVALMTTLVLWRAVSTAPHIAVPLLGAAIGYWSQSLVAIGSVSVDWIGWIAAGGAATFGRLPAALPARSRSPFLRAAVIGAAAVLVVSGYSAFQANRELYAARVASTVGRSDRALPRAEAAVRLDSGRAEHWIALGLARQDRNMLPQAAQALREAAERAPHVAAYWSSYALTLTNLARAGDNSFGGKAAALAAARRGVEADPNYPTPHHVRAVVANALGEYEEALESSLTAIRIYKKDSEYETVAADAALRLQDTAAARMALERVVQEKDVPVIRVALARLALKVNDVEAARGQIRRALELDPQNVPARELAVQLGLSRP